MHQNRYVRTALAQGREVHGNYIQAKIQVLSKSPSAISGLQVAVRRRDHANINVYLLIAAHWANFFFL